MFEGKVYEWLKDKIGSYLFGFDKEQFNLNLVKGEIRLKNANIKPDKVNELLEKKQLPFCLKAGMLVNVRCEVNKLKLLSEVAHHKFGIFGGRKKEATKTSTPV